MGVENKQAFIKKLEEHNAVRKNKKKKKQKNQQTKTPPQIRRLHESRAIVNLKEVNLYFRVSQAGKKGEGYSSVGKGYIVWEYGGRTKEEYLNNIQESTSNRSLLNMVIYAISNLKEPCKVNIYTLNAFGGMSRIYKKNWVHRDLGDKLLEATEMGKHELHFYSVDRGYEESLENLEYVGEKLKKAMLEDIK